MAKVKFESKVEKFFYRRHEAAFALGISISAIDALIADQRLTTRHFGRCVLIPARDVQQVADTILQSDMLQGVAPSKTESQTRKKGQAK